MFLKMADLVYIDPTIVDANCDVAPEGFFLAESFTEADGTVVCVYGVECDTLNSNDEVVLWEEGAQYTANMLVRDPLDGCVYKASDDIENIQITLQNGLNGEESAFYQGLDNHFNTPPSQTYNVNGFQDGNYFAQLWYKTSCPCASHTGSIVA